MTDKIWYDMMHTKYGDRYLVHYLDLQKKVRKWFKITTLIFSTGGIFGWAIWDNGIFAIISCFIIATIQIFNLLENHIILSDEGIEKVSNLRNQYLNYFNQIEKLWTEYNADRITDEQASDQFYTLRQIGETIEAKDNKLDIKKYQFVCKLADTETRNYFNQYHS